MAANRRAMKRLASRGFTLIELIMVMVILGILAVVAIPRVFDRKTFEARGFYDQTQAMMRYAQKVAIAQHRNVFVNVSANVICLTYVADASCVNAVGVLNPADQKKFSKSTPNGVSLTPSNGSFSFSALGAPVPNAAITIGVTDNPNITVERETGYVH